MEADAPVSDRVLTARYRIGALLGRGGMAEVYDGFDERLHRPVAVKVLRPDLAADPTIRTRFEVEARAAAGLSHPNVVAVFDTGEDDGTPYIVMERLPGETLADHVATGPVDQEWLRRVAGDVLAALASAHAAGVVHRDVKPGNILIGEDGCAKVADFGIAKSAEVAADVTGTGMLIGTPAYLAPERLDGRPATPQSDLYSLGVVLYEALTGTKPYEGPTSIATAEAVLRAPLRPLEELRPDVDPALAAAVERAMARDPGARPPTASAMAKAIGTTGSFEAAPTVALGLPDEGADPTLVGASVVEAGVAAPPGAGPAPAVTGSPPAGARVASWRRPTRGVAAVVAGAVILLGLLLMAVTLRGDGDGDGGGSGELVASIRDLGQRVQVGDGPMGPTASDRLEVVADQVEAGGGSDEATRLLADASGWNASGQLSDQASEEMVELLGQIDGVDTSVATTTTTTTSTTIPPAAGDDEDDDRGKGKKGRDD
jgi:hypothetical protein